MLRTIAFAPMPTYVYKFVDTGETIEIQQAFTDDTLTEYVHPDSGATMAVKKVFTPVGVTFKGGGFYKTDSRTNGKRSGSSTKESSDSSSTDAGSSGSGSSGSGSSSGGDSGSSDASSGTSTEKAAKPGSD
jgi:predicted nucleic acid-binding Zn ribbon protein